MQTKGSVAILVVRTIRDDLVNAGADFVDAEVVRDGNLITSRTPDDIPAFCREIVRALKDM
jgi:protease I